MFDDIDGWDRIVYNTATEFYHDYSDYEVEFEVPDNFMVWASFLNGNYALIKKSLQLHHLVYWSQHLHWPGIRQDHCQQ